MADDHDHGDHGHGHGHDTPEQDSMLQRIEALSKESVHHAGDHEGPFSLHVLGLGKPGAALITTGRTAPRTGHLSPARDNGLTEEELKEVIIHLAFYAGWPRAMSAITVAKQVFAD